MCEINAEFAPLIRAALSSGAYKAAVISSDEIVLDRAFREMCESNVCGNYGQCWMCPPDAGDINVLQNQLRNYRLVLVYQTVHRLKNADDRDEMLQVGTLHNRSAQKLRAAFLDAGIEDALHFGAGGCRFCRVCAKKAGLPCRSPQKAIRALEAYGIDAAKMAASAGMEYFCERGSISYFGAVFFNA